MQRILISNVMNKTDVRIKYLVITVLLLLTNSVLLGSTWTIPGVADTPGANGTQFVSSLELTNGSSERRDATIHFLPADDSVRTPEPRSYSLNPGETVRFENVLQDIWNLRALQSPGGITGALRVEGDPRLVVKARTFNRSGETAGLGTYGSQIPVVEQSSLLQEGEIGRMAWVSHSADRSKGHRTNLGVVFPQPSGGRAQLVLRNAEGQVTADVVVEAARAGFRQVPVSSMVAGDLAVGHGEIRMLRGSGSAYTSVVDNFTGDSSVFTAIPAPVGAAPVDVILNGVGRTAGANSTFWQTDVRIHNPSNSEVVVIAVFLPGGQDNRNARSASRAVGAGQTVEYRDVLRELFDAEVGSSGALRFTSQSDLVILGRTYNSDPTGQRPGSFGAPQQAVPVKNFLRPEDAVVVAGGVVHNDRFRTNVLATAGPDGASATFQVRNHSGVVLAEKTVSFQPLSFSLRNLSELFANVPEQAQLALRVHSGTLDVQLSIIDRVSGDSVISPAFAAGDCDTPRIVAFSVEPSPSNQGVIVSLRSAGAVSAVVHPGNFSVSANGSTTIPSSSSNTYTVTVQGACSQGASASSRSSESASVSISSSCTLTASLRAVGSTRICEGTSATLELSISGGQGPYSVEFLRNGSHVQTGSSSTYRATADGSYSARVSDSRGCSVVASAPVHVTVEKAPEVTVSAAQTTLNYGAATSLHFTLSGVTSWKVTSSGGNTISPSTGSGGGTFSASYSAGSFSGDDFVTITATGNCGTVTKTISLRVVRDTQNSPLAVSYGPTGATRFCSGGFVDLKATATGGTEPYTYTFLRDGSSVQSGSSSVYRASTGGSYTLRVRDARGAEITASSSAVVSVDPPPAARLTVPSSSAGLNSKASFTVDVANTTSWTLTSKLGNAMQPSSGSSSGSFTVGYTAGQPGDDVITLTASGPCGTTTQTANFKVSQF